MSLVLEAVLAALVASAVAAAVADGVPPRIEVVSARRTGRWTCASTARRSRPTSGPTRLKKPVLYPLRSAKGTVVTRGFPLEPRPGERVDHPHHVGLWFNYGDVNGVDFWNNADGLPADRAAKMGTIVHRAVTRAAAAPARASWRWTPTG